MPRQPHGVPELAEYEIRLLPPPPDTFQLTRRAPFIIITNTTGPSEIKFSVRPSGVTVDTGSHFVCLCAREARHLLIHPGISIYHTTAEKTLYQEYQIGEAHQRYTLTHRTGEQGLTSIGSPSHMLGYPLVVGSPRKITLRAWKLTRTHTGTSWHTFDTCECDTAPVVKLYGPLA
jgi:hypothetical protein